MNRNSAPRGYLLDIEGVLVRDKRYLPVPGALDWMEALRDSGVPYLLVSNNSTHRPDELVATLARAGFPVGEEHLVGALDLARRRLRERGRRRLMWLGTPALADFWQESGFELVASGPCDAVVLGANSAIGVGDLERALATLLDHGADLICLHRNPYYLDESGRRRLGPGAWAAALEAAGGAGRVITVGKPAKNIYLEALERIGVPASDILFISDDPINDLVTARRLGMTTAFVLSGKHGDHAVLGQLDEQDWPHLIGSSLGDIASPARPGDLPGPK